MDWNSLLSPSTGVLVAISVASGSFGGWIYKHFFAEQEGRLVLGMNTDGEHYEFSAVWYGGGACWDIQIVDYQGVEFPPMANLGVPYMENKDELKALFSLASDQGHITVRYRLHDHRRYFVDRLLIPRLEVERLRGSGRPRSTGLYRQKERLL